MTTLTTLLLFNFPLVFFLVVAIILIGVSLNANRNEDDNIEDSVVFPNKIIDTKIRKSKSLWLPTDGWIAGMLAHFIYHSNFNFFHYDLIYINYFPINHLMMDLI